MAFTSLGFLGLFLPVVFFLFEILRRRGPAGSAQTSLIAASLVFYGWQAPWFLAVITVSAIFNFFAARKMELLGDRQRSMLGVVTIAIDVAALALFKYVPGAVLPLGFSFYTFSQLAYVIDVMSGATPRYSFKDYFSFVLFFPCVSAGPISDHSSVVPQLNGAATSENGARLRDAAVGVTLLTLGLFKKAALADGIAMYARPVFDAAAAGTPVTFVEAWVGALAFFFQLYFDFSGYSDMAVGAARLFGVRLPWNFDSPYKAWNVVDFWRRWHMSLSNFLTNYIYTPIALAMTRRQMAGLEPGKKLTRGAGFFLSTVAVPCLLTMFVAGIWHGTGWTFLVFGALHGMYLVINHAWLNQKKRLSLIHGVPSPIRAFTARFITMVAVLISFVFFNAMDISTALGVLRGMAGLEGFALPVSYASICARFSITGIHFLPTLLVSVKNAIVWIGFLSLIVWLAPNSMRWCWSDDWRPSPRTAIACGLLASTALWCLMTVSRASEFVYFQF